MFAERINETPVSLLERLRGPAEQAQEAWSRFVRLYTPLLFAGARRFGLTGTDADDLVQDVFTQIVRKLPEFVDQQGKFHSWLWKILSNKCRECRRRLKQIPCPVGEAVADIADADNVAAWAEAEYNRHIVAQALEAIRPEFSAATWAAFGQHVTEDRPAAEVAVALGVTVNVVHLAKSRVLRRLREEFRGLID